jgi:RNA polymerase sigma-70 factor (ECF subfamily)
MADRPKKNKTNDQDLALITAINSGQVASFHTLVDKYSRRLYNFGLKMCKDVQDAEDLVQDTFLNVFRYLNGFRFETKFRNWLYRIAASTCIKKKRRSKFAPEQELSLEEFTTGEPPADTEGLPDWVTQPLDRILNQELGETLQEAILKLPKKYRIVLVLRDLEGFSTNETANILNLSTANIKVRLHRARLFLRDELKGYFKDEQNQA